MRRRQMIIMVLFCFGNLQANIFMAIGDKSERMGRREIREDGFGLLVNMRDNKLKR